MIDEHVDNPKFTIPEKIEIIRDALSNDFVSDGKTLYRWNGRIYEPLNSCEMSQLAEAEWKKHKWSDWTTRRDDEIQRSLVRKCYNKEIVNTPIPVDWILFKNIIYDVKNKIEILYSREHFITKTLAFDYYPFENDDSRPNLFIHRILEVITDFEDYEKFLSFMQYALTTSIDKQKALILLGPPGTGKSKLAEFMIELFGDRATTFELSAISGYEGYKIKTKFKDITLAYSDEIGGAYLYVSGMERLKNMITNSFQSGRAAYKEESNWLNSTKFIFTTNHLPALEDPDDEGFYRRFEIIELKQFFYCDNLDDDDMDPQIDDPYNEILQNEPGQVLSMIARHECKYNFKPKIEDIKEKWLLHSDSVYAYIKEYEVSEIVNSDAAYSDYVDFCAAGKWKKVLGEKQFLNRMTSFGVRRPRSTIDSIGSYARECRDVINVEGAKYKEYIKYCEAFGFEPKPEKYFKRRINRYITDTESEPEEDELNVEN